MILEVQKTRVTYSFNVWGKDYIIFFALGIDLEQIVEKYNASIEDQEVALKHLMTIVGNVAHNNGGNLETPVKLSILYRLTLQKNITKKEFQLLAHYSYWIKEIYSKSYLKALKKDIEIDI